MSYYQEQGFENYELINPDSRELWVKPHWHCTKCKKAFWYLKAVKPWPYKKFIKVVTSCPLCKSSKIEFINPDQRYKSNPNFITPGIIER